LASPYQWPWVDPISVLTVGVDSTPAIIYGQQITSFIDSVHLCNTTDQDIYVDIKILGEREEDNVFVTKESYLARRLFIPKFGSIEVMGKPKTMQSGDLMYANSDFSGNFFDSHISARVLLETQGV
jgi:hypothetical protein